MKIAGVVAVMALLAGPVWAQTEPIQKYGDPDKEKSRSDIEGEKAAERAYKRSLGNIPEQQKSSDPWGSVRSESTPPKAAKASPAKPKAKSADSRPEGAAK